MSATDPSPGEIPHRLGVDTHAFTDKAAYDRFIHEDHTLQQIDFEHELAKRLRSWPRPWLPGFCHVCQQPTRFYLHTRVSWAWRNTQHCRRCGLIARHRLAFGYAQWALAKSDRPRGEGLYVAEQASPLFHALEKRFPGVVGSEYISDDLQSGDVHRGLRHEDATALSFADASFDLVMSNDVLEHVPAPERAFAELARIVRPGGRLFATFPFHFDKPENTVRTVWADGELEHVQPPEYHGNPLHKFHGDRTHKIGSLVFTDFGWEVLGQLAAAGFHRPVVVVYWSYAFGHLGIPSCYIEAQRT